MSGTELLISVVGSVALLLWGVRMVRTGVMRAYGGPLRQLVGQRASNRIQGFLGGIGLTMLLQSSTATGLIVSSFASRSLIAGVAGLAVMLGADVGSSLVLQVLSLRVAWLPPIFIGVGVVLFMASTGRHPRNLGRAILGVGLVLLALQLLVQSSAPLRGSETVSLLLGQLSSEPLLALLVAAALTWLAHSSVAIVLLIAALASAQVIDLPAALALVLGANLGSAILPAALTLHADVRTRRITVGNLLMRGSMAIAMVSVIPLAHAYLAEIGVDHGRHVVNLHLAFNLVVAGVFLPLLGPIARLMTLVIKEADSTEESESVQHLDTSVLDTPALALACATRETLRMGDKVAQMLARTMDAFRQDDMKLLREIERSDDVIDTIHEAVKLYVTKLTLGGLDEEDGATAVAILSFAANLEHIGDIIDKNLMDLAAKRINKRYAFSAGGMEDLVKFHGHVQSNLQLALNVFVGGDHHLARQLLQEKTVVRDMELTMAQRHYDRVAAGRAESIETSSLHLDVLRDLKRINSHLTSVAYPILEGSGELANSRLKPEAPSHSTAAEADGRTKFDHEPSREPI